MLIPKFFGRDKGDSAFVFGADKGRKQISGSRFTPLESDSGDMVTDSSAKTQDLDLIVNKMKKIPGPSNKLPQASKQLFKAGVSGQTSDGSKAKQAKGAMGQGLGSSKAQLSKSKKFSGRKELIFNPTIWLNKDLLPTRYFFFIENLM